MVMCDEPEHDACIKTEGACPACGGRVLTTSTEPLVRVCQSSTGGAVHLTVAFRYPYPGAELRPLCGCYSDSGTDRWKAPVSAVTCDRCRMMLR